MEKENVEYISLDVLVEGLPESLRSQFKEIASGYGIGKRWTIAAITKYLVGLGYRDVSFRKHLTMPDGLRFYVDVLGLKPMLVGCEIADIPVVIASIDPCMACANRIVVVDIATEEEKIIDGNVLRRRR